VRVSKSSRSTLAALVLAGLAGCASCDHVPEGAVTDCNAQVVPGSTATDLLFVVDDSGSMSDYQTALSANLAAFIDQLLSSAIALDVRIGVTNSSVSEGSANTGGGVADGATAYVGGPMLGKPYPQGSLLAVLDPDVLVTPGLYAYDPAVYGTVTGGWGGHRMLSTSAAPAADVTRFFKANVRVGAAGSGKEQPLRAMRLAIDKAHRVGGENLGFLRDGARLVVVILTDEDDCSQSAAPYLTTGQENSATDPGCHSAVTKARLPPSGQPTLDPLSDFVTLLDTTVGGQPIVAVIAGFDATTLDPTGCTTVNNTSSFDDPVRLDAFLTMLASTHPNRTYKDSICKGFGPALTRLAGMIIPQTMPLEQAPADWRMMAVAVRKASGATQPCAIAAAGSPGTASAGVIYTPAPPGGLPSLTFQGVCRLGLGDRVDLRIVCAR
jgi:hypothetical protein